MSYKPNNNNDVVIKVIMIIGEEKKLIQLMFPMQRLGLLRAHLDPS
jgi:hypothetical protein